MIFNRRSRPAVPSVGELEQELFREKFRARYKKVLRSTLYTLVIVAAVSVLVATLMLPVLQIYGNSMTPTLTEGEIVVSVKAQEFKKGEIVAFYFNNRILVKRIIASAGQWVDIKENGDVYVDDVLIDEPYLVEKAAGESDIKYPYEVPQNAYFVLGDHRATSTDSRSSVIGCIDKEDIVGRIIFTVWPLKAFGGVK